MAGTTDVCGDVSAEMSLWGCLCRGVSVEMSLQGCLWEYLCGDFSEGMSLQGCLCGDVSGNISAEMFLGDVCMGMSLGNVSVEMSLRGCLWEYLWDVSGDYVSDRSGKLVVRDRERRSRKSGCGSEFCPGLGSGCKPSSILQSFLYTVL